MENNLACFTDILSDEIPDSQPLSLSSIFDNNLQGTQECAVPSEPSRPLKYAGQHGEFRSIEEIDHKFREIFTYPFFNLVQSRVIEDALYSDKSMVVCAPTGSGKTVIFEMAIVQLLMEIEEKKYDRDFKIIYMAPVKALCTERLTEWYSKFTKLGLLCIEVTGDTDVDFNNLKPYRVIITTPEKWDMMTRRWRDHRGLVELIKLFLIDEVHILNDDTRGPVLEAVVSRMKTIESSTQFEYRIEQLQRQYQNGQNNPPIAESPPPRIRFVAVSATVSNPEDVASWLGNCEKPAVYYKFGDECRPVKLKKVVEGYPCTDGTSIFKFDIILNYKLWPIIQKYHDGKPTLIFCNTRKSVTLTAEALSREITISFNPEQRAKLTALASTIKNKKLQALVLAGVGCHHAGLLFEERLNIETAFRNRDLPILITTTTLAMGVNLPAHLVIIKNTQQYVNGAYQEYSISTVLQMVGRAGRPQFDTEATAVIMTRASDKPRYEALVCGSEPLQSYLHKRLPENLNSEAALGTVKDVAECVQWLRSTFLYVRAAKDPKRYLGLPNNAPHNLISKKIEELCVRAMNGLASSGLITMDEASCIESTEAGRLMSIFYLDLETMKHIMKIEGTATLEQVLWVVCESHELSDMHLRVDERRCLNALNRNSAAATIRFPMKGKISTRQMKLNCVIQAVLGCLPIPDPSVNQEAMKIMRIADRVCRCLVAYVTRPDLMSGQPLFFSATFNSLVLSKCIAAHLWENSPYVSKQLKGIGATFSTLLATAGKINFMLLEESHPRDLERIMNKGPPAGNVLRKQISLLPKYQITMTPIDEKIVTMQLTLLNHNYLAENMENLTAGERHKCYIIAGDSENHLLLLTSFQDKDLIGMYDGRITHEINRKHNFEHKITTHCVSSKFVGIDAQCEYVFKDLESAPNNVDLSSCYFNKDTNIKTQRQTCITDVYKERKRRNKCDSIEICKSKEKRKRESVLAEKIRLLKESFGKTTKGVKEELHKSAETSNRIVQDILNLNDSISVDTETSNILISQTHNTKDDIIYPVSCDKNIDSVVNNHLVNVDFNNFENNEYIDDSRINDILKDIESEICEEKKEGKPLDDFSYNIYCHTQKTNSFKRPMLKNQTNFAKKSQKSNFNFMELLDKNVDFNEEENSNTITDTGFLDTIKLHINKYLQETRSSTKTNNLLIDNLIGNEQSTDLVKMEQDTSVNDLPVVTLNSNNLDGYKPTTFDSEVQNNHARTLKLTKENIELTQSSSLDKSIIPLHTETQLEEIYYSNHNDNIDDISYQYLTTNSKNNALKETTSDSNNKEKDVNIVLTEKCEQNRYSYNDNRKLEIENMSHRNTFIPRDIYDMKPLDENLLKNDLSDLSENFDYVYQHTDNHNEFQATNETDTKSNYVKNFKYSAMNVDISTSHSANRQVHIIKKIKLDVDVTEIVTNNDITLQRDTDFENASSLVSYITQDIDSKIEKPVLHTQVLKPIACRYDNKAIRINMKNANSDSEADNLVTFPSNLGKLATKKTSSATCTLEVREKDNTTQMRQPLYIGNRYAMRSLNIPEIPEIKKVFTYLKEPLSNLDVTNNNNIKLDTRVSNITQGNTGKLDKSFSIYQDNLFSNTQILHSPNNLDNIKNHTVQHNDKNFNHNAGAKKQKNCSTNQENPVTEKKRNNLHCVLDDQENDNTVQVTESVIDENKEMTILVADVEDLTSKITENPKKENTLNSILQKYSRVIRKNTIVDEKTENMKLAKTNNEIVRKHQSHKRPFKITDINNIDQKLPLLIPKTPKCSIPQLSGEFIIKKEENKIVPEIATIVISESSQLGYNDDIIPKEEVEHLTPTPSEDVLTVDYKIDDSMLNPKTLLQCLINDEPQIIPPPPEFSDFNYSPPQAAEMEDINAHESVLAELDNDGKLFYNYNAKNEYKSMQTQNKFQINNSSNEIETLLLSNNDDCTERMPWNIEQSPAFRNMPDGSSYTARRPNLNNFKFTSKKKFKLK